MKRHVFASLGFAAAVMNGALDLHAQVFVPDRLALPDRLSETWPAVWSAGYRALGGYGGGTAAGNYMAGVAQVIRAQGEYNEATTQAYINYEAARAKYLANRKAWTEIYFAMREENQARRAAMQAPRPSFESLTEIARSGVPRALANDELDPLSGRIAWPELLAADRYAPQRKYLDEYFEIRATTSGAGLNNVEAHRVVQEMIETLKVEIQEQPTVEYIAARKFLDSLAHATRT